MAEAPKKTFEALLLLVFSVLFAFGVAEGFFRLFPGFLSEETLLRIHWRDIRDQPVTSLADPYIGFHYPPHHLGKIERGDFSFTYKTDSHGFRNPSPWPQEAEIVITGDSLTFGYGAEDQDAWTAVLAENLPQSRLINLGLIGAAPQQSLRIYEKFGVPLRPKVLLFGLFLANDFHDASLFERWLDAGGEGNYDVWRFFQGDVPGFRRGISNLIKKSYLLMYLREVYKLLRSTPAYRGRTLDFPDGGRLSLAPNILNRTASRAKPDTPEFRLLLQTVEGARTLAEQNGTHFLVLLFPSKEEVYLPILGEPCPEPVRSFVVALGERGIEYLDLTGPFQESARDSMPLFHEVDGHPNDDGYALVADVVLKHLRNNSKRYSLADWKP